MLNLIFNCMKRIYVLISAIAIIASALVALRTTSNHSSFLFDANVEALAQLEAPSSDCQEYCYMWYGGVCIVKSSSTGQDVLCTNMSKKIIYV